MGSGQPKTATPRCRAETGQLGGIAVGGPFPTTRCGEGAGELVTCRWLKRFRWSEQAGTLDQGLQPSHALIHMANTAV